MAPFKILIINPNTNQSMTDSLRAPIESLDYNNTKYTYLTAPTGVPSINNLADAHTSATHTLPAIIPHIATHDAFLVACYSPHPLVGLLRGEISKQEVGKNEKKKPKPVLGIFEASVVMGGLLVDGGGGERFGIVSTGDVWKGVLERAVREDILGVER
ncbi:hypothetical protein BDR22DRAFT_942457, partial [Usnea florida]